MLDRVLPLLQVRVPRGHGFFRVLALLLELGLLLGQQLELLGDFRCGRFQLVLTLLDLVLPLLHFRVPRGHGFFRLLALLLEFGLF